MTTPAAGRHGSGRTTALRLLGLTCCLALIGLLAGCGGDDPTGPGEPNVAGSGTDTGSGADTGSSAGTGASAAPGSGAGVGTSAGVAPVGRQVDCPAGEPTVSNAAQLKQALVAATAGTVVRLAPGTYAGEFELTASGTEQAPIWVCGPREAVIDGQDDANYLFHVDGASWVNLVGFSLRNGQKGVVADRMQHGVVANLSISTIGDEAIHLRTASSDNLVTGNVIRDTGNRRGKFGEGVYVGSATSNWCKYTNCEPDRSDRNSVIGNDIGDVTSEAIDIKEGSTGGVVSGNVMTSDGLVEADSFIDVKGNGWTVEGNTGTGGGPALEDGIQVHVVEEGWGENNVIRTNRLTMTAAAGVGVYIHERDRGNVVGCDNQVSGAAEGLSNIDCT